MDNTEAVMMYSLCLITFAIFTHIAGTISLEIIGEYALIMGMILSTIAVLVELAKGNLET
ncbi:hypothetical protein [Natrinema sp. H-ect4]|uniref:hypothetical protein n=1 Tax=Natrinema sp. H-ect4 TaxID=3242699 RepID=UPI0035A84486